jgi:GcrA cell cycle regulator
MAAPATGDKIKMSWTDERVELLRKLWADGLSASQIAAELGGITRNAVIGKVHRLQLSGRAKPSSSVPRIRKPRASTGVMRPRMRFQGNTALAPDYAREAAPDLDPIANVIPIGPRVSITELNESTCRWPVGDPGAEDFGYCGAKPKAGVVYCPYHARIAYQPLADRRRERRAAQAR